MELTPDDVRTIESGAAWMRSMLDRLFPGWDGAPGLDWRPEVRGFRALVALVVRAKIEQQKAEGQSLAKESVEDTTTAS